VTADRFCLASAGAFFLTGLLTGVWKYAHTLTSAEARAPVYVDTAHRASLLYAFACVLLAQLCQRSAWRDSVNLGASLLMVVFFAASVLAYVVHGVLRDTSNQLQRPHRLGKRTIPAVAMLSFMTLLSLAEIGGFLTVLSGFLAAR
jgi:hypothetical protein